MRMTGGLHRFLWLVTFVLVTLRCLQESAHSEEYFFVSGFLIVEIVIFMTHTTNTGAGIRQIFLNC